MVAEVNILDLVKVTQSIAIVIEEHNVFGVVPDDVFPEDKERIEVWIAHEKANFVCMVLRQALDPLAARNPLVLDYKDTGARIELDTKIWAQTALLSFIKVTPALAANPKIDYEALERDIKHIREWIDMD
jgi:hypothetical protein